LPPLVSSVLPPPGLRNTDGGWIALKKVGKKKTFAILNPYYAELK
jgi:hypothetical protein